MNQFAVSDFVNALWAIFSVTLLIVRTRIVSPSKKQSNNNFEQIKNSLVTQTLLSVIVPARNEANNIANCLASLVSQIVDFNYEIIIVDDQSTDATFAIANQFKKARVISGVERPQGWRGKQWACAQGAEASQGKYLLFTDADTQHEPHCLQQSIQTLISQKADLLTAIPFLIHKSFWQKLTGPLHLFAFSFLAPACIPRHNRVFAIGQFLLFSRTAYNSIGGHSTVKNTLVEDVDLGQLMLKSNFKIYVENKMHWYNTKMYDTWTDFVAGWRRNIRAGLLRADFLTSFYDFVYVAGLNIAWLQLFHKYNFAIAIMLVLFLIYRLKNLGQYHFLGTLFIPISSAILFFITSLSVFDIVFNRPLKWKARSYES